MFRLAGEAGEVTFLSKSQVTLFELIKFCIRIYDLLLTVNYVLG